MNIETLKAEFIEQVKLIQSEDTIRKLQELLNTELAPKSTFEGLPDFDDDEITLADFRNRKE